MLKSRFMPIYFVMTMGLGLLSCTPDAEKARTTGDLNQLKPSEWVQKSAHELKSLELDADMKDLAAFKDMVGDARLVCLGEARHDAGGHFKIKGRLIRFLIEEMGFKNFIMEEGMAYATRINDYIRGGQGNRAELLSKTGYWFFWDTTELLDILDWIRSYNAGRAPEEQVEFFGCDPSYSLLAADDVLDYIQRIDPEIAAGLVNIPIGRGIIDNWQSWQFAKLSQEERAEIRRNAQSILHALESKRDAYIAASSEAEYQWMEQMARLFAVQGMGLLQKEVEKPMSGAPFRERCMEDNIRWLIDERVPGERAVVWAHNFHIGRNKHKTDLFGGVFGEMNPMIAGLATDHGDQLLSVGMMYHTFPGREIDPEKAKDSVDSLLAEVGPELFYFDLRTLPQSGPAAEWFGTEHLWPADGPHMIIGTPIWGKSVPAEVFDIIFFTKKLEPTHLSETTQERISSMGD